MSERNSTLRRLELLDPPRRRERLRKGGRSGGPSADINVTPLVDVVLVLLIIFMVVTPMLERAIKLPEVPSPKNWAAAGDDLQVSIDKEGTIMVGDSETSLELLDRRIEREMSQNLARQIFLEADRTLEFAKVRPLLEALRSAGAHSVGLASKPEEN